MADTAQAAEAAPLRQHGPFTAPITHHLCRPTPHSLVNYVAHSTWSPGVHNPQPAAPPSAPPTHTHTPTPTPPTFQALQHDIVSPLGQQPQPAPFAPPWPPCVCHAAVVLPHHHAHALAVAAELQHCQQLQALQGAAHFNLYASSGPVCAGGGARENNHVWGGGNNHVWGGLRTWGEVEGERALNTRSWPLVVDEEGGGRFGHGM